MTMTSILRYMNRNDPNGEYDDAIAIAEGTDTAKQAEVAREVMTILDRWMDDIGDDPLLCSQLIEMFTFALGTQPSANVRIRSCFSGKTVICKGESPCYCTLTML